MEVKPILFSTAMVQALLEGRKKQTRRIVMPKPYKLDKPIMGATHRWDFITACEAEVIKVAGLNCKYGRVGDLLYVRETLGLYSVDKNLKKS